MDITAIVVAVLSLVGVIITNLLSHRKIEYDLQANQAVTTTELNRIAEEVAQISKEIKNVPVMLYRLDQLEQNQKRMEAKLHELANKQ
ncbi:MAG: hypothetical protein J6U54_24915 [Clostridiales bacterium]|nr:hypothetical protein [Clostridiales bacterium]